MDAIRKTTGPPTITQVVAGTGPFAAARPPDEPSALRAGGTGGTFSGGESGWLCYTEMPDDGDGD
ncbi:MAG TPA: hypothetical protein VN621_02040 [Arthrobacter sp.]|nr:hypothetical protein [Arthrobacter sp.]